MTQRSLCRSAALVAITSNRQGSALDRDRTRSASRLDARIVLLPGEQRWQGALVRLIAVVFSRRRPPWAGAARAVGVAFLLGGAVLSDVLWSTPAEATPARSGAANAAATPPEAAVPSPRVGAARPRRQQAVQLRATLTAPGTDEELLAKLDSLFLRFGGARRAGKLDNSTATLSGDVARGRGPALFRALRALGPVTAISTDVSLLETEEIEQRLSERRAQRTRLQQARGAQGASTSDRLRLEREGAMIEQQLAELEKQQRGQDQLASIDQITLTVVRPALELDLPNPQLSIRWLDELGLESLRTGNHPSSSDESSAWRAVEDWFEAGVELEAHRFGREYGGALVLRGEGFDPRLWVNTLGLEGSLGAGAGPGFIHRFTFRAGWSWSPVSPLLIGVLAAPTIDGWTSRIPTTLVLPAELRLQLLLGDDWPWLTLSGRLGVTPLSERRRAAEVLRYADEGSLSLRLSIPSDHRDRWNFGAQYGEQMGIRHWLFTFGAGAGDVDQ